MKSEIMIDIQDVHKSYGRTPVLRGINLPIARGEVIALIGPSGSGKSTLLRCINLLEKINHGRILVDGADITAVGVNLDAMRRRIGIVFQSFNLFPHLDVIDNITLAPRKVLGQSSEQAKHTAMELLTRFGLADKANASPDQLSGGQQQRVAIIRALAMSPEIMLFDEITSALDPALVSEVLDIVRELATGDMTLLLATHEMGFAREVSSRVAFLNGGQLVEIGSPEQVFFTPQHEETRTFLKRVLDARRM
jgi:polar amino acid transport system ATP-binding protein